MIKRHIPNFITTLNLASGFMGIVFTMNSHIQWAVYMVLLAAVFDFTDGFAARLLKSYSTIGKSLDSLADVISFGLLPGILVYSMQTELNTSPESLMGFIPYTAVLIPSFSALRLAIFDNDENQRENFRGLPTPANALFFASLSFFLANREQATFMDNQTAVSLGLFFITIFMSFLLVSRINMFSLKFRSLGFKENMLRYIFILGSLVAILVLGIEGIAITVIPLYIFLSVVFRNQFKMN